MKTKEPHIVPFSNGTEFWNWRDNNCEICENNSNELRNDCKLKIAMELGAIGEGTIPLDTAQWIGYNGLELNAKCNMFNIQFKPATIDYNAWRQLSLF